MKKKEFKIEGKTVCVLELLEDENAISLYIPDQKHNGYFEHGDSELSQSFEAEETDKTFNEMVTDLDSITAQKDDNLILRGLSDFMNKYELVL